MSVARGFGLNGKSIYSNVAKLMEVNCNFTVDSTNGNGLGIRSLKSNGYINNVFMHTAESAGSNNGMTNPNPLAGYALVQFKNNFNYYLGGFSGFVSPVSGSAVKIDNSVLTPGQPYIITTLGNATLAKWQSIGFPVGFVPQVGASFIATSNGGSANTSTSRVMAPSVSGSASLEVIGNANLTINNSNIAVNAGAILLVQFLTPTIAVTSGTAGNAVTLDSGTTLEASGGGTVVATMAPLAPADGSVVGMKFYFDGSSVTVDGI